MKIVSLVGLKKTGKTTTAEALIAELRSRDLTVGAVKYMPQAKFTVDTRGKDTWRHKEAGADHVISLSPSEIAYIRPLERRPGLDEAIELSPDDTDVLLCEGLREDGSDIQTILVASSEEGALETLEVRGPRENIIAISGRVSNDSSELGSFPDIPVINATTVEGAKTLCDLIMS